MPPRSKPWIPALVTLLALLAALAGWYVTSDAPPPAATPPDASATPTGDAPAAEDAGLPATTAERTRDLTADPSTNTNDTTPRIHVTGVVLDAHDERPLAGAEVGVRGSSDGGATSDDEGRFELSIPFADDDTTLRAACDDHLPMRVIVRPADVCEGEVELRIELPPARLAGGVVGTVVDAVTGAAMPGVDVRLAEGGGGSGPASPHALDLAPASTDEQGRFALRPLPPGRHDVLVRSPRHETWRRNAVEVEARRNADLGTIELQPFAWGSVHGRIVDAGGAPVADVAVECRTKHDKRTPRSARSDEDGRYRLDRVAPGSVVLTFDAQRAWMASRTIELQGGEESSQDVQVPSGTHHVGGTVVIGGRPAAGFDVECDVPATALAASRLDGLQLRGRLDARGRFRVDGLPAGPVDLSFSQRRPWVLEGVEGVAVDRVDHWFTFDSVASTLTVRGVVRGADGVPIQGVTIAPDDVHPRRARDTTTIDGAYRVTLAASGHTGIILRASHPRYVATTKVLGATDGDELRELDFVMTAKADITPLTVRAVCGGKPVRQAHLILHTVARTAFCSGVTDAFGSWRAELAPQPWMVFVSHPDFEVAKVRVDLTNAQDAPLDVELTPRRRYALVVELRGAADVPLRDEPIVAWERRGAWIDEARTDELGRARFDGLPGDVVLSAAPAGHARHELSVRPDQAGDAPVLFRVTPGLLTITGQVLDAVGAPVAHAEVHCKSGEDAAGVQTFTNADGEGRFSFANMPAGDYTLIAYRGEELGRIDVTSGGPPVTLRAR